MEANRRQAAREARKNREPLRKLVVPTSEELHAQAAAEALYPEKKKAPIPQDKG